MSNRRCVPFVVQGVAAFALCASFLLVSCGGGSTSAPAPPTLQSITVSPGSATVAAGLTQQYTATGNYSDGSSQPLSSVTWATSDATLATVNTTGLVTTLKQGQVKVSAASGAIIGNTGLTVGPAILQALSVSPQNATVAAGLTQQFAANGTFSDGTSKTVSAVTWSVSDTTLATVDSSGLATTLKQGSVIITAASGSISNTAPLNVGPPIPTALNILPANDKVLIGATAPTKLSAILIYSDGSTTDVSSAAAWSVTNSFVASIDASGNVTTLRTGFTGVSATDATFSASTGFTVIAEPRYLYFPSQAGRLVSKAIIDYESGQPFMAGYIPSGVPNSTNTASPCPTTDPLNQFLYVGAYVVANPVTAGEIQIYSIDPVSGALGPVTGSPFSSSPVSCIDFEPTGKFGFASFAVNNAGSSLVTYSRDVTTGLLTVMNTMNLNAVPSRTAIDPLGQYLYVAVSADNFNTTSGLGFTIDSSMGTLTPITGSPFNLPNADGTPTFHPSGNYVFMVNGHSIDTYSVARSTGALTLASTIPACISSTPVRFSPDGAFAYMACSMDANHNVNPSLESFAVGPNGALTHIGSTSSLVLASDVTVDPSGQFLYLSTIQPNILAAAVGSNGVAGLVRSIGAQSNPSQSNVVVGGPTEVTSTPKTAYVTSTGDNTVSTYSVNVDGTLTIQQSLGTFPSPFSLSLWPWGTDLVFATEGTTPDIDFFSLSPTTGLLTSNGALANARTSGGTAIDPSGQFAFQTDSANGVVYTYEKLNGGGWGLVTFVATPPVTSFPAGPGAGPIVVDPSGSLVYVANQTANSISAYEYFGTSPELIPTTGSPFAIGAEPLLMAIDPTESFLYVGCGDQTLRVFSISYFSGGAITQVASVSLAGPLSGLTVEPNGGFIYTSDSTGVSAFSVNAQTGALTAIPLSPAITLSNTTGVFAEPSGQYLYVTTGAQNVPGAVFGYSVNSDGTLTAISTTPLATPKLPSSMVFSDTIQ